jgi:hypothetical protein
LRLQVKAGECIPAAAFAAPQSFSSEDLWRKAQGKMCASKRLVRQITTGNCAERMTIG